MASPWTPKAKRELPRTGEKLGWEGSMMSDWVFIGLIVGVLALVFLVAWMMP